MLILKCQYKQFHNKIFSLNKIIYLYLINSLKYQLNYTEILFNMLINYLIYLQNYY